MNADAEMVSLTVEELALKLTNAMRRYHITYLVDYKSAGLEYAHLYRHAYITINRATKVKKQEQV
jgi:hypothetical protein